MIAHASPASGSFEETRNTLLYADRAKNIKTNVSTCNIVNVALFLVLWLNTSPWVHAAVVFWKIYKKECLELLQYYFLSWHCGLIFVWNLSSSLYNSLLIDDSLSQLKTKIIIDFFTCIHVMSQSQLWWTTVLSSWWSCSSSPNMCGIFAIESLCLIVSATNFSTVNGSRPRAYLSRNRRAITWVANYKCPIWTFCNWIPTWFSGQLRAL